MWPRGGNWPSRVETFPRSHPETTFQVYKHFDHTGNRTPVAWTQIQSANHYTTDPEVNDIGVLSSIITKYKNHPSIIEIIKNKNCGDGKFSFCEIEQTGIKNQIPPKLIKLFSEYLFKPLTDAINSSIRSSTFPDNGKRASVTPLDKGGPDKTIITNYRPISVLNTFSKFYENVIKNRLTSFINKRISVFISAYRNSYSTQHVL